MNSEKRDLYLKDFPDLKSILKKADASSPYDKGKALWLVNEVDNMGVACISRIEREKNKKGNIDMLMPLTFLLNVMKVKLEDYREEVKEYLRMSELSKVSDSFRKAEQRMRANGEDSAVKFCVYINYVNGIIKDKKYIEFYDKNKGVLNLMPDGTRAVAKKSFDVDNEGLDCDELQYEDLKSYTKFTDIGVKREINKIRQSPLSNDDLYFLTDKYCVAYVDITGFDLHKVALTVMKAEDFKKYWGFEERELYEYKFNVYPIYINPEEHPNISNKIYFKTYAGINKEIVVFYYLATDTPEDEIKFPSDRYLQIVSPTYLKKIYPDLDDYIEKIHTYYVQGYIENGNIFTLETMPYSTPVDDYDFRFDDCVTFRTVPYQCRYPYHYTFEELNEEYMEELADEREEKADNRAKERAYRLLAFKTGRKEYEFEDLWEQYKYYKNNLDNGTPNGIPKKMTIFRFYQWLERGAPLYERSHKRSWGLECANIDEDS